MANPRGENVLVTAFLAAHEVCAVSVMFCDFGGKFLARSSANSLPNTISVEKATVKLATASLV